MNLDESKRIKLIGSDTSWLDTIRSTLRRKYGDKEILLTVLKDGSGVLAVFPMGEHGKSNAQIIDRSGSVRCEIAIPITYENGLGFADAYYVNGDLTAIFVSTGRDFAFVIDESTGAVIRSYETR